jgi:hypothetical protein
MRIKQVGIPMIYYVVNINTLLALISSLKFNKTSIRPKQRFLAPKMKPFLKLKFREYVKIKTWKEYRKKLLKKNKTLKKKRRLKRNKFKSKKKKIGVLCLFHTKYIWRMKKEKKCKLL